MKRLSLAVEHADRSALGSIELSPGARLLDDADEARLAVPLSCRDASCGVCAVRVLEGEALLGPARRGERTTLAGLGLGDHHRLFCQLTSLPDARGAIRLRVAGPTRG